MHIYYALSDHEVLKGSFFNCYRWGMLKVNSVPDAVVKIFRIRAQEKDARVLLEITSDGIRSFEVGRLLPVKILEKRCCNDTSK